MYSEEFVNQVRASHEAWEAKHKAEFGGEEKPEFSNDSGIPLRRVYTPLDLAEKGFDDVKDLGLPGEFPYTRGITATMYRTAPWRIRQYAGISTAAETNRLFKSMIRQGQNALSLAFDLPTQLGYDSDDPRALGEVGKVGLTINSLRDWEIVFDGIDVDSIFVNSVSNAQSAITLAMHVSVAKKQGIDPRKLKGSLQNDILKEYICRGNFIFPVAHGMRLAVDTFMYCMEHLPEYWPVNLGQVHLSEAGASLVNEATFALGNVLAYMDAVVARGGDIDRFASRFSFAVSQDHTDFFGEIAKLRAQRRLLARLVKERYGAKNPESMMMRVFSTNGGSTMSRPHPVDNQTRNAIACLIGALSGVQMIGLRTMDEVLGIPSEDAVLASIRTQEIVAWETNLRAVVDPLGGSYYVEWLTSEMEERIRKELDRIAALGGMVRAIEKGHVQRAIMEDAYQVQRGFEAGDVVRVGVNKFVAEKKERHTMKPYQFNPDDEAYQVRALAELRKTRDNERVRGALDKVRGTARTDANLMPAIIEAVEAYATTGEICAALKEVFGEYKEPALF